MPEIKLGNTTINYSRESSPKTIKIIVDPVDGVIIRAPQELAEQEIIEVLNKKANWLLQKVEKINTITEKPSEKDLVSGEKLLYLGHAYRLKVYKKPGHPTQVKWRHGKFIGYVNSHLSPEDQKRSIRDALNEWYFDHAEIKFLEIVKHYVPKVGVIPKNIALKELKGRWGNCTKSGELQFNWRIIMAPVYIIIYVIVHEICHLVYPDHSSQFWNLVGAILADYEKRRDWLRVNGPTLAL